MNVPDARFADFKLRTRAVYLIALTGVKTDKKFFRSNTLDRVKLNCGVSFFLMNDSKPKLIPGLVFTMIEEEL
jgi:hypothetical protein